MTGVYLIRCVGNDQVYVGSAAVSFAKRFAQHRHQLRRGQHRSRYMQRSWEKYGEASFVFEVLERCDPVDAVAREQVWLDRLQPTFNTARVAGSSLGIKRTPEQRARLSKAHKNSNNHRPGNGAAHLTALVKTPQFRARQAERLRSNIAAGLYARANALRSERLAKKHLVHGELLTLAQLATKYGRTVKSLQRRVERGARGDDIVAPPYASRRA